ncbi:MAG: hypothetical protein R3C44_06650 [Chloroflexota bacterium]
MTLTDGTDILRTMNPVPTSERVVRSTLSLVALIVPLIALFLLTACGKSQAEAQVATPTSLPADVSTTGDVPESNTADVLVINADSSRESTVIPTPTLIAPPATPTPAPTATVGELVRH